jgi:hypothetical protein
MAELAVHSMSWQAAKKSIFAEFALGGRAAAPAGDKYMVPECGKNGHILAWTWSSISSAIDRQRTAAGAIFGRVQPGQYGVLSALGGPRQSDEASAACEAQERPI